MTKLIKGTSTKGFDITSGGRWKLEAAALLTSTDKVVLDELPRVGNDFVEIRGSILAEDDQIAIRLRGTGSWMELEQEAVVTGRILVLGKQSTLVNFTDISANGTLLVLGGERTNSYNTGSMTAENLVVDMRDSKNAEFGNEGGTVQSLSGTAIIANGSSTVYNSDQGSIIAAINGVQFLTTANEHSTFKNYSTISAGEYAFLGGKGRDHVMNSGTMTGDVALGAGNDIFEPGMIQELNGTVYGGKGDDTLIIQSSWRNTSGEPYDSPTFDSSQFVERPGGGKADIVRSMYDWRLGEGFENLTMFWEYNIDATGNSAANIIIGNIGNNHLSGLAGDDELSGGGGRDIFHFADGFDKDKVLDFEPIDDGSDDIEHNPVADIVDLTGLTGVESFDDLMDNHIRQSRRDILISSGDDQLRLVDVKLGKLSETNFLFADLQ